MMKILYFPKTPWGEILYDYTTGQAVGIYQLDKTDAAFLFFMRIDSRKSLEDVLDLSESQKVEICPRKEKFLNLIASILKYHFKDKNGKPTIPAVHFGEVFESKFGPRLKKVV